MREHIRLKINDAVYQIYKSIDQVRFPLDPLDAISMFPNCRHITYDDLSVISGKSHDEIIKACESYDGCTKYDRVTGRYLILVNHSNRNIMSANRIRWTTAHELGHIVCGHFEELSNVQSNEMQSSEINSKELEEEADFFAGSLLAPLPALCKVGVKNVQDIKKGFGISQAAAEHRWIEFKDYLFNSSATVYSQKPSLWSLFREREIICPIPYHFRRTPKLPRIKAIDISLPDTD